MDPPRPEAGAGPGADARARLRLALAAALRARDMVAVSALRSALDAIGNAEAVEPGVAPPPGSGSPHVAGSVAGLGAAEAERRRLSAAEIGQIVRAEAGERERAARDHERAGHAEGRPAPPRGAGTAGGAGGRRPARRGDGRGPLRPVRPLMPVTGRPFLRCDAAFVGPAGRIAWEQIPVSAPGRTVGAMDRRHRCPTRPATSPLTSRIMR